MKQIILFFTLFLLFLTIVQASPIYHCDTIVGLEGLCFDVTFAVTTDAEMKIPSKYNFPHFIRFGDHLYIKEVKIYNLDGKKATSAGTFTLNIRPIDYIDKPYTDLKKIYPENYGQFTFYVNSLPPRYTCNYTFDATDWSYKSTCKVEDVSLDRFTIELFKEGEWVIVDEFIPKNKSISSYGHTSIFNGDWKENTFRVTSGFEMDNLRDLKSSLKIVFFALMVTMFSSVIQFYYGFKGLSKKEQKNKLTTFMYRVSLVLFILAIFVLILFFRLNW